MITSRHCQNSPFLLRELYTKLTKSAGFPFSARVLAVSWDACRVHESKRLNAGRGAVGKTAVVAAVERNGDVIAEPVDRTDKETLQGFVRSNIAPGSLVMTDESASYRSLSAAGLYDHATVNHSGGEYVVGQAHTNTVESFWAMLQRGSTFASHAPASDARLVPCPEQ